MSLYSTVSTPTIFTNSIDGFATTLSGGVVTLTTTSSHTQYFTGTSAHTVTLPVATTLALGQEYYFRNLSSGLLTINTSGGNLLATVASGNAVTTTCTNPAGGTGTASWRIFAVSGGAFTVMDSTAGVQHPTAPATDGVWYGEGTRSVCEATSVVFGNGATKLLAATDCIVIGRNASSRGSSNLVLGSDGCRLVTTLTNTVSLGDSANKSQFTASENTSVGANSNRGVEFTASFSGGVMTVTALTNGFLFVGMPVYSSGAAVYNPATAVLQCTITGLGTGSGNNVGTYFVTAPVTTGGPFQCIGGAGTGAITSIGYNALACNTGSSNTAVGARSCEFNIAGINNVAMGNNSLIANQGSRNVAIGSSAAPGNFSAALINVSQTGTTITSPIDLFIPDSVGGIVFVNGEFSPITGYISPTQVTTNISRNVASVGFALWSGFNDNTVIGSFAATLIKSGRNVVIGSEALYGGFDNINSGNCTAVGYQSLRGCGNGGNHTAVGYRSALNLGYGNSNVSVGSDSMLYVGFGNSNTVVGSEAQQSAVNFAFSGIASSVMTVTSITSGQIYVGMKVYGNTTSFGGFSAPPIIATVLSFGTGTGGVGTYNVDTVNAGGNVNATGMMDAPLTGVTAVGYRALQTNGRSANTGIGHQALRLVTSGTNNTGLGFNVGSTLATGSGNTLLGAGAGVDSGTRANSVALGSSIIATQDGGFFVRHRGPAAFTVNNAGFIAATNEIVEVSSSIRTKENVVTLEDTSTLFEKLRPVRYTPKLINGLVQAEVRDCIGFIAEEVAELYPEVVTYSVESTENTEVSTESNTENIKKVPAGMMYDRLVPVLTAQIQSLMWELKSLRELAESL